MLDDRFCRPLCLGILSGLSVFSSLLSTTNVREIHLVSLTVSGLLGSLSSVDAKSRLTSLAWIATRRAEEKR